MGTQAAYTNVIEVALVCTSRWNSERAVTLTRPYVASALTLMPRVELVCCSDMLCSSAITAGSVGMGIAGPVTHCSS
jgi:hypothetical protein